MVTMMVIVTCWRRVDRPLGCPQGSAESSRWRRPRSSLGPWWWKATWSFHHHHPII